MWILELIQNEGASMLSTMSSIHSISSILTEFEQERLKKTVKQNKTKKWATLDHSLHFVSSNHELSFKLFLKNLDQLVSLQNDVM
jgi:hypothetical protein